MGRIRTLAQTFREFATNHVEEPDVPAVADGDNGYARSTKIALLLLKEEIDKPLRDVEDYLNKMPSILDIFGLDKSPDYTSFSNWDEEFPMQELRRLLRASAEQAGLSGTASVDASGFQRDQASSHYRNRVGYSFNAMKTTLLVDTESLAIMDAHFTTKKPMTGISGCRSSGGTPETCRRCWPTRCILGAISVTPCDRRHGDRFTNTSCRPATPAGFRCSAGRPATQYGRHRLFCGEMGVHDRK